MTRPPYKVRRLIMGALGRRVHRWKMEPADLR